MPASGRQIVTALLESQRDLVTPAQAKAAGAHSTTLPRLTKDGVLETVEPGVYGTPGVPYTWERRVLAATFRAGHLARASHLGALRLLEVETYEGVPPEITIPSKRTFHQDGVIVHQSRDLRYVPPVLIGGIPCTPPRRLAVDLGAVLGETAYTTAMRALRRDHGVTWKQMAAILELHSKRGRAGCGALRRHLERYAGLEGVPDSTLEQLFLDDLLDAGFPVPVCQYEVPGPLGVVYRIDFAYPCILLAVEVDGPHHRLDPVRARDRRRDAYLRSLGWEVLRFDEEAVSYSPMGALWEVRCALEARGGWG
ncbi:MAG TPA: type IV toxin-antitoxin system AbiEi family antitoxin domain-containing protein [Acidimicrobiales bacterium]|nr:type IV toxin-antitoxin system AbiEi family antitoxin domain-containing protein [Acidimicrobiales bacterium]